MKRLQLIKHLEKHGCKFLREGSRHTLYLNPENGFQTAIGRHQELKNEVCRKICQQLGIPKI